MTQNAKAILVALVPNAMFVCILFGWMAGRMSSGASPFPNGVWPAVMMLIAIVPIACAAAGNYVRMAGRSN